MKIELGQKVQDVITGFEGVVTGRVAYISGCKQNLVAPRIKPDGTLAESQWFDEDRLTVLDAPPISLKVRAPGPDKAAPKR
mgnify:CR=1 FL=1